MYNCRVERFPLLWACIYQKSMIEVAVLEGFLFYRPVYTEERLLDVAVFRVPCLRVKYVCDCRGERFPLL